jgi:hypothetical protein
MSNQAHLLLQIGLIAVLSSVDGLTALVQHPEWFQ